MHKYSDDICLIYQHIVRFSGRCSDNVLICGKTSRFNYRQTQRAASYGKKRNFLLCFHKLNDNMVLQAGVNYMQEEKRIFMYKYTDTNSFPNISLSDCRIEKVRLENRDVIFELDDDGFWLTDAHPQNPHKQLLRTDKSELRLVNADPDFTSISYHEDICFAGKKLFTKRVEVSMGDFMSNINSGRWNLYVVDEHYGYRRVIMCCQLFTNKRPYAADVQIQAFFKESRYSWNKICEDIPW